MRKLIESTHVSLGGEIGAPQEWAFPYLNDEHAEYATKLLSSADTLFARPTDLRGLSVAYMAMAHNDFVDQMNRISKYVATRTLKEATWNATVIEGDVAAFVADLKQQSGKNIIKYGTGALDDALLARHLIDEFHFLLTPAAVGRGTHLFEKMDSTPTLNLTEVTRFASGVVVLVYVPG